MSIISNKHGKKDYTGSIINNILIVNRFISGKLYSRTENRLKDISKYNCKCLKCKTMFTRSKISVHKMKLYCETCDTRNEDAAKNLVYSEYKQTAKKRNLEFSIDKSYFKELIVKNCFYCNIVPNTESLYLKSFKYNGIDRFDSKLGYTNDNARPCCIDCNKAKWEMNFTEFKIFIERLYKNLCQ